MTEIERFAFALAAHRNPPKKHTFLLYCLKAIINPLRPLFGLCLHVHTALSYTLTHETSEPAIFSGQACVRSRIVWLFFSGEDRPSVSKFY